jgi:SHS2 domain-containing protein
MKKFEILEHRADLKIRAFGKTKEEIFLNMLLATADFQKANIENKRKIKRKIKIKSVDLPALLIDFLNEIIYLNQVNREVYFDIKFKKLEAKKLEGELSGQKADKFDEDIKAATFHNLDIHRAPTEDWEATVVFDI